MRHVPSGICALVLCGSSALLAADVATTQPESPANTPGFVSVPTPTAAASAIPAEQGSILVLPMAQAIGTNYPWLSRALQQDLQLELSRSTRAKVVAPSSNLSMIGPDSALKAGRDSGATHVVYGQYQVTGNQIRVNGSIIDIASGKSTGTFSASGDVNNIFPLEESVAGQLLRDLPQAWATVRLPPVNASGEANGEATQPSATVALPSTQYYSYTYPNYSAPPTLYPYYYAAPYPYTWYTVPYYGPDIYFYGGWGFYSHHYWDHRWGGFHDDGGHGGGGHGNGGHGGGGHGGSSGGGHR